MLDDGQSLVENGKFDILETTCLIFSPAELQTLFECFVSHVKIFEEDN